MTEQALRSKPIDKWIPWFFVMFFAVIFAVNAVFVTVAIKTQPGTVVDHAYERGLHYNATLAGHAAQEALGWDAAIVLRADNILQVSLRDETGAPLDGAEIIAKVQRPVQDGYDFDVTLLPAGTGRYSAPFNAPLFGQWQVRIFATWQDKQYQNSQIVIVR